MLTNFPRFVSVVVKRLLQEKLYFDSFEMLENWLTFAQLVAGQYKTKRGIPSISKESKHHLTLKSLFSNVKANLGDFVKVLLPYLKTQNFKEYSA